MPLTNYWSNNNARHVVAAVPAINQTTADETTADETTADDYSEFLRNYDKQKELQLRKGAGETLGPVSANDNANSGDIGIGGDMGINKEITEEDWTKLIKTRNESDGWRLLIARR